MYKITDMSQNTDNSADFNLQVALGVRAAREARGEAQAALAARAGVARTTLIGIEAGRGAHSGSMARVLQALDLTMSLDEASRTQARGADIEARRWARLMAESKARDRREAHVRIAARLLANDAAARGALNEARRMVGVWRKSGSCSPAYVDAWEKILAGSPAKVGRALISLDEAWANALLQNTPFGSALADTIEARVA